MYNSRDCSPWTRGGAEVARQAHNLKVIGSNPIPATKFSNNFMPLTDDLKKNIYLRIDGKIYFILDRQYKTQGRQGGLVMLKLKNVSDNTTKSMTVNAGTKFEEVFPDVVGVQYLYSDDDYCYFMDMNTFETINVSRSIVGDYINFLKEGEKTQVLVLEEKVISMKRQPIVKLEVTESIDDVKSNAATDVTKSVTVETGYKVNVPLFIRKGDVISINTDTGEYTGRAN